jgi:hypothetical protein
MIPRRIRWLPCHCIMKHIHVVPKSKIPSTPGLKNTSVHLIE